MSGQGEDGEVLLGGAGEAKTLFAGIFASGNVELVEVVVLVEGVECDVPAESCRRHDQYVLSEHSPTLW